MLLKTSLGSAYVHNIDLIDKSKEIILFIPGAGMDHRVADLLHPDPKIFKKTSRRQIAFYSIILYIINRNLFRVNFTYLH